MKNAKVKDIGKLVYDTEVIISMYRSIEKMREDEDEYPNTYLDIDTAKGIIESSIASIERNVYME